MRYSYIDMQLSMCCLARKAGDIMEGIKRFIECLLPYYNCNIKCDYCYVIQGNYRGKEGLCFDHSFDIMRRALTKERFGGICFFSICAGGETLAPSQTIPIVKMLLENGHVVNVTTNGTLVNRIDELCMLPEKLRERLHLSLSLHYLELKRLNLLDTFFANVERIKRAKISFFIQLAVYDGYQPYVDEINRLCMEVAGAFPQAHVTRRNQKSGYRYFGQLTDDEYVALGRSFCSPLFEFTLKNFMKKQREFCYAGDWSFILDLGSGTLRKCYDSYNKGQQIFEAVDKPIKFEAIGRCESTYCVNSSHFMAQGIIPTINAPTYAELRNRGDAGWYSDTIKGLLSGKLFDSNAQYSIQKRMYILAKRAACKHPLRVARVVFRRLKRITIKGQGHK